MEEFYHLSPVVLTDDLYFQYQPLQIMTGTAAQRTAAYLWAEQMFIRFAGSPIYETTVTGTYPWPRGGNVLALKYGNVRAINAVVAISQTDCNCTLTRDDGCGIIVQNLFGYVDLRIVLTSLWGACGRAVMPYQMEVSYTTGFPTGTIATDTSLHIGLAQAATIMLNEMIDPAANEGGEGDPGVKSEGSLGWNVTKKDTPKTPWGNSSRAAGVAAKCIVYKKKMRTLKIPSMR